MIINCRFASSVSFHDILHGLRAGRSTDTTSLEAKLLQHLKSVREDFLYAIFLYLHKAYEALDTNIYLEMLEGYIVVPQACGVLSANWKVIRVVSRAGGYYRIEFQGFWGLAQGGLLSPRFSMCWWSQWCVTGYCWWWYVREGRNGEGGSRFNVLPFPKQMTAWLNQLTRFGCRKSLTPSPGCSIDWGSIQILRRYLGCSASPETWLGPSWRRFMSGV